MNYLELLQDAPLTLLITGSALAVLTLAFLFAFLAPAILLRLRLGGVRRRLRKGKSQDPQILQTIFARDVRLLHLWSEFRDTLHEQREERDGQMVTVALRATAPAESYFNNQYVVESRLRTEFFKHLPGIFTGIGIIGTFTGLITGLQNFQVPDDPAKVRHSLEALLSGVFEAFIVSAAAITLAMIVTFLEKVLLSSLYRCTEDIAQHLDGLFTMGAGEEYLSRLVSASESSAAQSKILKDSLVGDLKLLLQEITDRQIAAQQAHSQALGEHITSGIEESLKEPLKDLRDVVAKASGDQSSTAATLLQDAMASFSERISSLFGGQISGIQELNQKSAQAMQDVVASLQSLLGKMEEIGQRSGDAMAEKMATAVEEMERRQSEINEQTRSFVDAIRDMVEKSQTETNARLNDALTNLSQQMGAMIGSLQAQAEQSHQIQQQREQNLTVRTTTMVSDLGASIAEIVKQMAESTDQMRLSVATLERTTTSSIDKLSASAKTLEQGATAFSQAGERVTTSLSRAGTVADKMAEVSGALTSSATSLQNVLADYRANRDATASMLDQLRSVVDSAKREASLTQSTLDRIQAAAEKLAEAHRQTEDYLDGVSNVLAEAHAKFADGLSRTLDRANSDFHIKLSSAVKLLGSAVEELEVTLSSIPSGR